MTLHLFPEYRDVTPWRNPSVDGECRAVQAQRLLLWVGHLNSSERSFDEGPKWCDPKFLLSSLFPFRYQGRVLGRPRPFHRPQITSLPFTTTKHEVSKE